MLVMSISVSVYITLSIIGTVTPKLKTDYFTSEKMTKSGTICFFVVYTVIVHITNAQNARFIFISHSVTQTGHLSATHCRHSE